MQPLDKRSNLLQQTGDIQLLRTRGGTTAAPDTMIGALQMIQPLMIIRKKAMALLTEARPRSLPRIGQLPETNSIIIDTEIARNIHPIRTRHTEATAHTSNLLPRRSGTGPRLRTRSILIR